MKEVCFPLTSNDQLCKRVAIVNQLKKLVKEVECDDKSPLCRARKEEEKKKSDDPRCYCACAPGFHHHVMVDGQLAKPEKSESENIYRPYGKRWCPPCMYITPLMDPIHSCYRADMAHGKEGDDMTRNGMPPEEKSGVSCRRTVPQQMGSESSPQDKDPIQDDVFGGQKCPYVHPPPTRGHYYCPEGDPFHVHWSPPRTVQCRYPNTCVASCFQHPAVSDWIYKQPKYRSYLQNVNDKPFKKGF